MERWTPVVCTGREDALFALPNKSVRPPNAVKLDNAFKAPGFESNWANGSADARGEGLADVVEDPPELVWF